MVTEVDLEKEMLHQTFIKDALILGLPDIIGTYIVIITISHGSDDATGSAWASICPFDGPWVFENFCIKIVHRSGLRW